MILGPDHPRRMGYGYTATLDEAKAAFRPKIA
jgi:hypothetical protein